MVGDTTRGSRPKPAVFAGWFARLNVIGVSDHFIGLAASVLGIAEHTSRCMVLTQRQEEDMYAPLLMKATVCSGS